MTPADGLRLALRRTGGQGPSFCGRGEQSEPCRRPTVSRGWLDRSHGLRGAAAARTDRSALGHPDRAHNVCVAVAEPYS